MSKQTIYEHKVPASITQLLICQLKESSVKRLEQLHAEEHGLKKDMLQKFVVKLEGLLIKNCLNGKRFWIYIEILAQFLVKNGAAFLCCCLVTSQHQHLSHGGDQERTAKD